ncbi:hypothetical protein ACW3RQ_002582 [Escherichia coli]
MQTTRTPYSISFMATVLLLLLFACHSTVANAAVALGATRVIYPANQKLPNTMVPPKGEVSVDITHAATGDISFQTINDYGALTPRIKATMQ